MGVGPDCAQSSTRRADSGACKLLSHSRLERRGVFHAQSIPHDVLTANGNGNWVFEELPDSAVFEVRLQISDAVKVDVWANGRDVALGSESATLIPAHKNFIYVEWDTAMQDSSVSLHARWCNTISDTAAVGATIYSQEFPTMYECCANCYENERCESWVYVATELRCSLLIDVQSLNSSDGSQFGRIRGRLN